LLKSLFIVLWNFKLKLCERVCGWNLGAANEIGRDFICARVANVVRAGRAGERRRENICRTPHPPRNRARSEE
jgi:hypothetical protein